MEFEEFKIFESNSFTTIIEEKQEQSYPNDHQQENISMQTETMIPNSKLIAHFSQPVIHNHYNNVSNPVNLRDEPSCLEQIQNSYFFLDPQQEEYQHKRNNNEINKWNQQSLQLFSKQRELNIKMQNQNDNDRNQLIYHFSKTLQLHNRNKNENKNEQNNKGLEEEIDNNNSSSFDTVVVKEKDLSYQLVSQLRFQQDNLFDLFCDIPFSLDYYVKEIEEVALPMRSCIYNKFKKVLNVRSFSNGMMIDASLGSMFNAHTDFAYLINALKSKGNQQLFDLANTISQFQLIVNSMTNQAFSITNQTIKTEQKTNQENESSIFKCQCSQNQIQCNCLDNSELQDNQSLDSNQTQLQPQIDMAFLEKRQQASIQFKEKILSERNPNDHFYFKTYSINWENEGNLRLNGYGFTKGYCELMGLSIADYKQHILRKGFMENLNYDSKVKFMFPFFFQVPWSVKAQKQILQTPMTFTTYDNIIFTGSIIVEINNLSYKFDTDNNFSCDLCDTLLIVNIQSDIKVQECIFNSRRQRGKRSLFDDKDDDEIDFYYSKESQSFLERYYKDIYGQNYVEKKQLRRCEYIEIPKQCLQNQVNHQPNPQNQFH